MAGIGHVAVGMAAGRFIEQKQVLRAMFWFALAALLPDADVIGFPLGIRYEDPLGHRGASHSLLMAPLLAAIPALQLDKLLGRKPQLTTFVLMTVVVMSHGLLDALTDGGLGVALFWPVTPRRYFFPWRPLPVAPIGLRYVTSRYGMKVIATELLWFAPFFLYALWPRRR